MVIVAGKGKVVGGGGGAAGGGMDAGCGACCFEADPEAVRTEERWVYVGEGGGSYSQVANMEMVGAGRGEFEKEKYTKVTGWRVRACCVGVSGLLVLLAIFLPFGFANNWWYTPPQSPVECAVDSYGRPGLVGHDAVTMSTCCLQGYKAYCAHDEPKDKVVVHDKFYTQVKDVHVPHMVPVPIPPPPRKVITHHVTVHTHAFDCDSGADGYVDSWPARKQRYCCYLRGISCHTKVTYRPHYHTITHIKHVTVPVPMPIPAPPAQVINHVVNVPIHDPPQVIKVPVPGKPNVVPKYQHVKQYVPVPEPSPPTYHTVPVPVKVRDPGQVIKVPTPLPPATVVKNKVIYKTRHVKVRHIYDCHAGYSNWNAGWSSAKKSWCCSHESRGCPGDHSGHLTKTYVTHVTQHMGPSYMSHHYHTYDDEAPVVVQHVHHYHTVSHADMDGGFDGGNTVTHVVHHYPGDADVPEMDSGKTETHVVHHYADYGDSSEGSEASEGVSFGGGSFHHVSGGGSFSSHHMSGGGSFSSHHVSGGGSFSGGSFSSGGSHSFHSSGSFHHVSGSGSFSHSSDH